MGENKASKGMKIGSRGMKNLILSVYEAQIYTQYINKHTVYLQNSHGVGGNQEKKCLKWLLEGSKNSKKAEKHCFRLFSYALHESDYAKRV